LLQEVGLASLVNVVANYLAAGEVPTRYGNAHPNIAPYQTFATRDGYVALAVGNDRQFASLLRTLALKDTAGTYSTNTQRLARRERLVEWLGAEIAKWGKDDLMLALESADVPAGSVRSVPEALVAASEAYGDEWAVGSPIRVAPNPIRVDGVRPALRKLPPLPGEHTREVLAEIGVGETELAELIRAGVVSVQA